MCEDLGIPMSSAHDLVTALTELDAVRGVRPEGPTSSGLDHSCWRCRSSTAWTCARVSRPFLLELCESVNENTYPRVAEPATL
jgi:DNA-binding IclR family transcriptional regulator